MSSDPMSIPATTEPPRMAALLRPESTMRCSTVIRWIMRATAARRGTESCERLFDADAGHELAYPLDGGVRNVEARDDGPLEHDEAIADGEELVEVL